MKVDDVNDTGGSPVGIGAAPARGSRKITQSHDSLTLPDVKAFFSALERHDGAALSLKRVATTLIAVAQAHPARYRLLFRDPALALTDGQLKAAGWAAFKVRAERERKRGALSTTTDATQVAGLIHAKLMSPPVV